MSKNVYRNVPLDVSDRTRKKWGRITKSKNERGRSRKKRMRGREISSTDVFFHWGREWRRELDNAAAASYRIRRRECLI